MGNFLEDLKNAADSGEFNSEAAKKIIEINELADKKIGDGTEADVERLKDAVNKRVPETEEVKSVSEEDALELNSEYEKKMAQLKKIDTVNAQLATLIEIEDMVKASIVDMFSFVEELNIVFDKEFEEEDPLYGDLSQKLEQIESKYKSIIN